MHRSRRSDALAFALQQILQEGKYAAAIEVQHAKETKNVVQ
jgi:hypothetical protein